LLLAPTPGAVTRSALSRLLQEVFTMFSAVLLVAMSAGGESAAYGRHGGGHHHGHHGHWGHHRHHGHWGHHHGHHHHWSHRGHYRHGHVYYSHGGYSGYVYETAPVQTYGTVVASGAPAKVIVQVPEGARLTVDGEASTSTGTVRTFETPALPSGKVYSYEIKAEYEHDGAPVTVKRTVRLEAGKTVDLDLTQSAEGVAISR
jgi:uncharacterized protein (TIGR03000 family)